MSIDPVFLHLFLCQLKKDKQGQLETLRHLWRCVASFYKAVTSTPISIEHMRREKGKKQQLINGDKVKMVGAWCNVMQWVNSRVLWVKGVLRSRHLSVCPYICLPVCCSNPVLWCSPLSLSLALSCRASLMLDVCSPGGRVKTWKRRWFILTDNCLYYFEYTTVSTAQFFSLCGKSCWCCSRCAYIFHICAGQRAQRNHPTGEPEHQGSRG